MGRRRRLARTLRLLGAVSWSRMRHGPQQPNWSFPFELTMAYMREAFRSHGAPIDKIRRSMDAGGEVELRRRRVGWRRVEVAGLPAEWAEPPQCGERVIVYLHGGGYVFGSVSSHRSLIASLAIAARARVLAVEYRLAPEHPCPAAIDDVVAVLTWLMGPGGVSPQQVTLMGDSAGGGLSLATMQALRDAGAPLPRDAVLLSPWVDLTLTGTSYATFEDVDFLGDREGLVRFADLYRGELDADDPRVSPLWGDLAGLPPMLLVAGGAEILLDDSLRLAERAAAAGVEVRLEVAEGQVHVFPIFERMCADGKRMIAEIGAFAR